MKKFSNDYSTTRTINIEWDLMQELVSRWKCNASNSQTTGSHRDFTVDVVKNIEKVILFLNAFHEKLLCCQTPQECASKFPKGGTLLTDLVHIRILVLHPIVCNLLVKCIVEYSKFFTEFSQNLGSSTRIQSFFLRHIPKEYTDRSSELLSKSCGVEVSDFSCLMVDESVATIREFLETVNKESLMVPSQCLIEISDQCLPLLEDLSMSSLIDCIIFTATRYSLNRTSCSDNDETLSYKFVEKLLFTNSSMFDKLSVEAKSGLWASYPIAVENEIMRIFGEILFPENNEYMTPNDIKNVMQNQLFFERLIVHPKICHVCFDVLTNLIDESQDWRTFRLVRYMIQLIFDCCIQNGYGPLTMYLPQSFSKIVSILTDEIVGPHNFSAINCSLNQFLLDKKPSDFDMYKKKEWIILMSFPKWHYWIIESIFDVILYPDIKVLEDPIHYLTWLMYPSGNGAAVTLKNTLMDIIDYIRECLSDLHDVNKKILLFLNRNRHIFENHLILVDIILGIWKTTNSI
ncbi:7347_t:CDS:10, partial [Acaulospora morrowiae]